MSNKQIRILGLSVDTSIDELSFSSNQVLVNTINPHSFCVSKRDELFHKTLINSDVLIPDGIGIVLAARLLANNKIKKIAGSDLHAHLLQKANDASAKVFYLGSSTSTLTKIENRLKQEYPNIKSKSFSPPYKAEFSDEENQEMIDTINAFQPNVVFVGMTAPKQEKWAYIHRQDLNTNIIASIGAVFDFYACTIKRAPNWVQKIGMEWLHRSLLNPSKLGKRNMLSNPEFVWDVLKLKFKGVK